MLPLFPLLSTSGPGAQTRHHASLNHPSPSSVEENDDSRRTKRAQNGIGMQTMDQALRDLVLNGLVTYDDAMSRAHNPAELEVMIQGGMNGGN